MCSVSPLTACSVLLFLHSVNIFLHGSPHNLHVAAMAEGDISAKKMAEAGGGA